MPTSRDGSPDLRMQTGELYDAGCRPTMCTRADIKKDRLRCRSDAPPFRVSRDRCRHAQTCKNGLSCPQWPEPWSASHKSRCYRHLPEITGPIHLPTMLRGFSDGMIEIANTCRVSVVQMRASGPMMSCDALESWNRSSGNSVRSGTANCSSTIKVSSKCSITYISFTCNGYVEPAF